MYDLRLRDHPALWAACAQAPQQVDFVFVWGPPVVDWGRYSYKPALPEERPRISPPRKRFLLEALLDLARRVRLTILQGEPHEVLPAWAAQEGVSAVYAHREWAPEEEAYQQAVAHALQALGIAFHRIEGNSLYTSAQLPFPIEALPMLYTRFRQLIERAVEVKSPLGVPTPLPSAPELRTAAWLEGQLAHLPPLPQESFPFRGGEEAGQAWLAEYLAGPVLTYQQTRNAFLGRTFSSHLSPWLALGCLSPRTVYAALRQTEKRHGANDSTYAFFLELLWREYFRWLVARWGGRAFAASGIRGYRLPWRREPQLYFAWTAGRTGYPLVDAAMRELAATGWTSNRARQIVASFLTKNLFLDWRWGAAYFESQLIDYDVYSNWGNWLYQAGVGTDGRGFRWFDPVRQAKLYDPQGAFIRLWVPELRPLSAPRVFMPEPALRQTLAYPQPIVDWQKSLAYAKDTYWRTVQGPPTGTHRLRLFENET